jgi:hypothetical protein
MRWIALLELLAPVSAPAQVIQGKVIETASGKPVANVEVRLAVANRQLGHVVTDTTGRFVLRANAGGLFRLSTRHVAFAPLEADVEIGTGAMVDVVLRLAEQPTELPAIEVIARGRAPDASLERNGFYERRSAGFGVFRTPEDVERRRLFATSDLFLSVSGVRVFNAGIRGKDIRMTRGDDPNCSPRIFIDNVIARRGGRAASSTDAPLDGLVQPQDVQAVEIYRSPSETPTEYGGPDVTCGVVVIWTKRGSPRQ